MSTPTEQPDDLRAEISDIVYKIPTLRRDIALDQILRLCEAAAPNPWDFVQPCEPDCTPERHAYHEGQWNMAQRMSGSDFPTDQANIHSVFGGTTNGG